jgi:hypothetical protein
MRRVAAGGPSRRFPPRTWRSGFLCALVGVAITTGACASPWNARSELTHPISITILSHSGLTLAKVCNGDRCYYPALLLAATDLNRLREQAWASGSRPSQQECAVEPANATACWNNVPQTSHELFIAVYAYDPCATSFSVTADLVSQRQLDLQVTNSGQCGPGAAMQQQSHLSLLGVRLALLPAAQLTVNARRSGEGQIGETSVDLGPSSGS